MLASPTQYSAIWCLVQANEILHHKLTLNGYLAEFTGQSMDTITSDTDRDFFMSAQEAVRNGAGRPINVQRRRLMCRISSCLSECKLRRD